MIKILTIIFSICLILITVKGTVSTWQNPSEYDTSPGSVFESSNNNSRYILTKAITERGSFYLDSTEARFASPDVAKHNGNYLSLFMPGLSMISVPFYYLGSILGQPQIVSYLINIIFALLNGILISLISVKLSNKKILSILAGFCFIFATNAWAYALGFTQHHISTFLILLSLFIIQSEKLFLLNFVLGLIFGFGLLVDFPNIILVFPIILYQSLRHVNFPKLKVNLRIIGLIVGVIPPIALFIYYNIATAGSPFMSAQFMGRTSDFSVEQVPVSPVVSPGNDQKQGIKLPFKSRHQFQGLYILLASNERGWFYYSPAIIICVIGLFYGLKSKHNLSFNQVALSVVGLNILVYSMFGDPWGGWSFGPRYLIPATALVFIYLPFFFELKISKYILSAIFLIVVSYSVNLSSLGALTTSSIPPKQEAEYLSVPTPYTPELNKSFLKTQTSSLFYNLNLKDSMNPIEYHRLTTILTISFIVFLTGYAIYKHE